jgi:hypothetical protein
MMHPDALAALLGGSCLAIVLILIGIAVVPLVFYCLSMSKALTQVGPENRNMEPGMVWLLFIPVFHLVWHFFVVKNVSNGVKAWAAAHGREVGDGGWSIGLTACILACCCIIPVLGALCSLGALVCIIIWWIKVAGYNAMMQGQA